MEKHSSCKAANSSASSVLPHILWHHTVYDRVHHSPPHGWFMTVHSSPPLGCALIQINSGCACLPLEGSFQYCPPFYTQSYKWFLSSGLLHQKPVCISPVPPICHIPCLCCQEFDNMNYIWKESCSVA